MLRPTGLRWAQGGLGQARVGGTGTKCNDSGGWGSGVPLYSKMVFTESKRSDSGNASRDARNKHWTLHSGRSFENITNRSPGFPSSCRLVACTLRERRGARETWRLP